VVRPKQDLRKMVDLLDEYIPFVTGSEINDDPLNRFRDMQRFNAINGDTAISWLHRKIVSSKISHSDVTVADLIGDIDPIKAANLKLSY
jgi:magnesium chelatase subunit I